MVAHVAGLYCKAETCKSETTGGQEPSPVEHYENDRLKVST